MPPKKSSDRPKPNPLRDRKPINAPIANPNLQRQAVNAAARAARPQKPSCPNKQCDKPDVQDGVCHNCGCIIDDSNIVSEITFGESSSGAAVVQGSFVGADQGTARSLGPAFKRAGGMEDRESTVKEGKRIMQSLCAQLRIFVNTMNTGVQIFKLAAMNNFIQGRRMEVVSAVCLYSACRKHSPCKVMLIDFADKVQINVFKLGRTFKALHRAITISSDGIMPILPEDLIWRFASQLEFKTDTNRVAEDAIRMAQRMSLDWMVMGRRPSGVCGACIILAARMNNFRRTVMEVVYIVKVTTNTIQKRLEEFKMTPSAELTVDDFLNNEFLESAHDPPSFYEKSEEFQKKKRKRKHMYIGEEEENEENSRTGSELGDGIEVQGSSSNKRQRMGDLASSHPIPSIEVRRDAEGFVIPPQPTQPSETMPIDPALMDAAVEKETHTSIDDLVGQFGDAGVDIGEFDKGKGPAKTLSVPEEWAADEAMLARQIDEIVFAPSSAEHAKEYARVHKRVASEIMTMVMDNPESNVSMDVHIGEDEFKGDPEVENCLLSPADVALREKLWINENQDWLRGQALKAWKKRKAEAGPPKATRIRKKKPRMGEGQTSAASSPAEAAKGVMNARNFSKKVNYAALDQLFKDVVDRSANTSATSKAGSEAGSDVSRSRAGSVAGSSVAGSEDQERITVPFLKTAASKTREERNQAQRARRARAVLNPPSIVNSAGSAEKPLEIEDDEDEDDDSGDENDEDHVQPAASAEQVEEPQDDWKSQLQNASRAAAGQNGEDEAEDEDFDDDYGQGDMDNDGDFPDNDVVRGFGDDDGEDFDEDY